MNKQELKLLSWVLRGSQKREIIKVITGHKIPAQIYKEAVKINSKITRNSVSDVLRVFKRKKLVICINPIETKGRIYELTSLGKRIQKLINK